MLFRSALARLRVDLHDDARLSGRAAHLPDRERLIRGAPDEVYLFDVAGFGALDAAAAGGVVEIGDSGRYEELSSISVAGDAKVELRAANEDFVLGWAVRVAFDLPPTIRKAA